MELEALPQEESTAAIESAPLAVQHLYIATESREGDRAIGGNGQATGDIRRELAGPPIFGTAARIQEESPKVVDESVFELRYIGKTMPRRKISPTVQREARAFLSDKVWELLDPALSIAVTRANQAGIRIQAIDIGSFRDPEEGWVRVILKISVIANALQALAFWDSIGRAIDRWKRFLPADLVRILDDRIAVHIFWS